MSFFDGLNIWSDLLEEDAPEGDSTCNSLKIPEFERTAKIYAKEDIVLSGANEIFNNIPLELNLQNKLFFNDGAKVLSGQCIAMIEGVWREILLVERPLLNWLGHFSGISTLTHHFCEQIKHTPCKILDTRKTTPFFRDLEKKAVSDGGALNHRKNLSEALMLKENHLSLYDFSIKKAVSDCLASHPNKHLTVEASQMGHVELILKTKAHRVMLDNFTNDEISEALSLIKFNNSNIEVEASGNMTLDRVRSVAELGVDFISVGALTHSAPHADLTLLMDS